MYEIREPVTFTVEGEKIFAVSHKPLERRTDTTVLFIHGFGGNKIGKNGLFVNMALRLAKGGVASLRFDFRGAGDSEGACATLEGLLHDAEAAYDYIGTGDVVVIGTSMGGLVATLLCLRRPVKALVLWAPVFDAHQWRGEWEKAPKGETHLAHQGRLVSYRFFEEFFALSAEKVQRGAASQPLLAIAGGGDETVDATHIERYRRAVPCASFTILPQADHNFSRYEDREQLYLITEHWLQGVL